MPVVSLNHDVVPFVRIFIIFNADSEPREYTNCYAVHSKDKVVVREYGQPLNALPRAVYQADQVFLEHIGPHPLPGPPAARQRPADNPLNMEAIRQRAALQQAQAAPAGTTPEKQEAALKAFEQDALPAEENPAEKKFLEESPKVEAGPSTTDPEPTSVLPMVVTPSGRFAISPNPASDQEALRQDQERLAADTRRLGLTGTPQPYDPTADLNRAARRAKGSHKKARQLPGATLLVALALSLSVLFRHPGQ